MKKMVLTLFLLLLAALGALAVTFTPARLPVPADSSFMTPDAHPPEGMKIAAVEAGKMFSQAMFAYRGGRFGEERIFGMGGILVQHPQGTVLFDTGFGRDVDAQFKTTPKLMQLTSKYQKEPTAAEQLRAAGIVPSAIYLTHAHWDHVSGVGDFPGVPVRVPADELAFIKSGDPAAGLAASFGAGRYEAYDFTGPAYLGFPSSLDLFGDGSVVLVPAPGHTPGSIVAFIATPDAKRYALVGDMVWQTEGIDIPAERPWMSRKLVDQDPGRVRANIAHMHQLQEAVPGLIIVPAHDRRVWDALPKLGS
ncbi:MAG TPA: MBL fold metallo-hydrolase [Solimonas sp.]|nr:MBL fold metallo-hydrolase [Solimonas sp.]